LSHSAVLEHDLAIGSMSICLSVCHMPNAFETTWFLLSYEQTANSCCLVTKQFHNILILVKQKLTRKIKYVSE